MISDLLACFNATKYNSRSDSIGQQRTLEELQIRLITSEKKAADYESLQTELEEKKVYFLEKLFLHDWMYPYDSGVFTSLLLL